MSVVSHVFWERDNRLVCSQREEVNKKRSFKKDSGCWGQNLSRRWRNKNCLTVGVSSGLKCYGLLSGGENERNWEDEPEFAGVIICAQRKTEAVRRRLKGSVTSCDLGITPPFFVTIKHQRIPWKPWKRRRSPPDDDIVLKKWPWRREETGVLSWDSFRDVGIQFELTLYVWIVCFLKPELTINLLTL